MVDADWHAFCQDPIRALDKALKCGRTSHARAPILHHSSIAPLTSDQPHAPHFPALPTREPSVTTWSLNPSAGMPQLFVLLGLPLYQTEVAPVPLAFTEKMRYNASLPFPLLL